MSGASAAYPLCFIDTNIWLYAFIENQDPNKSTRAKEVVRQDNIVVSSQVINEICVNLIKKAHLDEPAVRQLVNSFYAKFAVVSVDEQVMVKSSQLREAFPLSFWDSLIVSSALLGGAEILYTEDMNDGLVIESRLRITNPLKQPPVTSRP